MPAQLHKKSRASTAPAVALAILCGLPSAHAQLNQNCTVSVLNRTVPVNADGTWVLPNVPANFGQVKARATCVQNGTTAFGESDFFTIPANGAVNLPAITLGVVTQIPTALTIGPASISLTTAGQTVQLLVTATYPDNSTKNVTAASTGTNYTISNPAIATITGDGLITAVSSGTVVIQANNDGATGIVTAPVNLGGANVGGIPVSWLLSHGLNPNDPLVPQEDPDRDGLTNLQEFQSGTDPNNPDTDGDGLSDGDEVNRYHTNPLLADTDGDGIPDGVEVQTGTNALDARSYDLRAATASSTVTPSPFTLTTSVANPVVSIQLSWKVTLIDGKTILTLTADPRTSYSSSDLNVCSLSGPGLITSVGSGSCVITISQNTLSVQVSGTVTGFSPTEVSTLVVPGAVAVDVAGTFAYVAAGSNGLTVVDVTDRTQPRTRGTLTGIGNVQAVRASGVTVFAADANGFLRVVNAQNPDAPALSASLAIAGSPAYISLHGATAAVAAQTDGVSLVNVANPASPSLIAQFAAPGSAVGFDFDPQTGIAAVAMGTAGLQVADISTPASPRLRGVLAGGDVRRVLIRLPAALLADAQRSITSVDISNPAQPALSTSLPGNIGGVPVDIAANGNTAMTADTTFGRAIPIINISNPLTPTSLGYWTLLSPGYSSSIALDLSYGYAIIPATSTLRILKYQDIVDPFGIAPTVSVASPISGPLIQGATVTLSANATDDVAVASVNLIVNGQVILTTSNPPYQTSYTLPVSATAITFGATAVDYGNNVGVAANVTLPVIPDPLTTATGRVVTSTNTPVGGAAVSVFGRTSVTASDGTFTLPGLPTIQGQIRVAATATVNGVILSGLSAGSTPVLGGTVNIGDIQIYPKPVISGINPRSVLESTTVQNFVVTGANFLNTTFSVLPAGSPIPITVSVNSIDPSGDSASLTLTVNTNAPGQFVLLATNPAGASDTTPSVANTIHVLDPNADDDGDGLINGLEILIGTDPLNPDTDGDGFSDGAEVLAGSDPLDPASTPLTGAKHGEFESKTFSLINTSGFSAAPMETESVLFSLINSSGFSASPTEAESVLFSLIDSSGLTSAPTETESVLFSLINSSGFSAAPTEAESVLFSLINTSGFSASPTETEGVLFSVINTSGFSASPNETESVLFSLINTSGFSASPTEVESVNFSLCNGTGGCPGFTNSTTRDISSARAAALKDFAGLIQRLPLDAITVREIFLHGVDSDHDGLPDEIEIMLGTNPFDPDTDHDGYSDGLEVALGSNPLDPNSVPVIELPHEAFPQFFGVQNTAVFLANSLPRGEQKDVAALRENLTAP